jgi:hypothetical protein
LLPTFLFVSGVYALFALLTVWRRRAIRLFWSPNLTPRSCWGALFMMSFGLAFLVSRGAPGAPIYHFNLVEVLGEEERGGLEGQVLIYPVGFPGRVRATEVPPIYSLLNPQMTTHPVSPEKKTSVLFLRKPQQKVPLRLPEKKGKRYSAMKIPGRK